MVAVGVATVMKPQSKPIDRIASLLDRLGFQPENVIQAASETPEMFREAIEFRRACLARRNQAEMVYERSKAEASLRIRTLARETGEKTTEDQIKSQTLLQVEVAAAATAFAQAEEFEEYSKLVLEAVRIRRDSVQVSSYLMRDDIRYQNTEMAELRSNLEKKYPGGS